MGAVLPQKAPWYESTEEVALTGQIQESQFINGEDSGTYLGEMSREREKRQVENHRPGRLCLVGSVQVNLEQSRACDSRRQKNEHSWRPACVQN